MQARERQEVVSGDQYQAAVHRNRQRQKDRVVLDIETFEKIEELLEDCGLALLMEEVEEEESLSLNEALSAR